MKYALGNMLNGGVMSADGLALDLQFAADKSLVARKGPTPTFTRASSGTFVGSNGLIQSAATNAARFHHDPATLVCNGLLLEGSRTNSILQSGSIGTSPWSASNSTISANAGTAPDGTMTASKLQETAITGQFSAQQSGSFATGHYVLSIFLKAAERTSAYFELGNAFLTANLSTGAITNSGQFGSGWTFVFGETQNFGNGWYRFSIVATCTTAGTYNRCKVHTAVGASIDYAGTDGSGVLVWGAQLEAISSNLQLMSSYIPTTTASVVRSVDIWNITGASFTQFYNSGQGTAICNANNLAADFDPIFQFDLSTNPNTNRMYLASYGRGSSIEHGITFAGAAYMNALSSGITGRNSRFAMAYAQGSGVYIRNGNVVASSTTVPASLGYNRVSLGGPSTAFFGCIASFRYYRRRLSNAKIQALTA